MLRAWWCGGPFVVPVCDLVFTFGLIIYISIEWIRGIFQITGVARIPAVILPTWTAPANALGSLWLPVVFCTAFLLLVLHVARMLVTVKHARNPLQPGVKHFIFGFSILVVLGFAGLCGLLAVDVFNAIQVFGLGVTCTPLAGVVNPACLAARTYFAGRHAHSIVLLALLITVSTFGVFGEIIIVWSVLRACLFGPHLHAGNPLAMPACASPCLMAGASLPHHSPAFDEYHGWHKNGGDFRVPMGKSKAAKLAHADGHLSPSPTRNGYLDGGRTSSILPSSRTVAHTKYSNPCHASCPLDADTQQRLGVENPVANTCKISINTGRQEKARRTAGAARVIVGYSSSSSDDERARKQHRLRKSLSRPPQRHRGRTARRRPRRSASSSFSFSSSSSSSSSAPPVQRPRASAGVPSTNCTGARCSVNNRRQHLAGPQPPGSGRRCSSKSGCKHVHSHPCKHQRGCAHSSVRDSNSCRRSANTRDARRHGHFSNPLKRACIAHGAPRQIPCNDPPLSRSRTGCHLPACSADRCAADASPVGVSTLSLDRSVLPRRRVEHAHCHTGRSPPTSSLYSHHSPVLVCRRGPSASTQYGGPFLRSHSSCQISGAGQITPSGQPACSKSPQAHMYDGPAVIHDHSCCKPQGRRDTRCHHPGSYRRYPSAPPFTSHSPPFYLQQRLSQPQRPARCPRLQRDLYQMHIS